MMHAQHWGRFILVAVILAALWAWPWHHLRLYAGWGGRGVTGYIVERTVAIFLLGWVGYGLVSLIIH